MAEEFTLIETQEQFDEMIKYRIEQAQRSAKKEYEGFDDYKAKAEQYDAKVSEYEASITAKDSEIADLKEKVTRYETDLVKTALAAEYHLDPGLKDFLIGDNEKDWRKSAEKLASMTRQKYPEKDYSNSAGPDSLGKQLLRQLKGD